MTGLTLRHLKSLTRAEAISFSLKVAGAPTIRLLPVGEWILKDFQLIELFARWRSENRVMYFSQFPESVEGMRSYLMAESLGKPSNILFVVEDIFSEPLGHIGLKLLTETDAEIDSVMKAPECKILGLMDLCLKALIDFAERELGVKGLQLEVMSYNTRAINLYLANGFAELVRTPLQRVVDGDRINHLRVEEDRANVDFFALTMNRQVK